jgi:hypothetical protein
VPPKTFRERIAGRGFSPEAVRRRQPGPYQGNRPRRIKVIVIIVEK